MIVTIQMIHETENSTLSHLFIDGERQCFILEDGYRDKKINGETRIDGGRYKLDLRLSSPMADRYNAKFADIWHAGMLWLRDVRDFEWIYLHIGNRVEESEGCLLVGEDALWDGENWKLGHSTRAYKALYPKLLHALNDGDQEVWVDVIRNCLTPTVSPRPR